jgi:hypothetical protein
MANKANKKSAAPGESEYSVWRVIAIFIEGIFGLINTNKIYPAFGLMLIWLAGMIVWRLPESELAPLIRLSIETMGSTTGGMFGMLIVTNVTWTFLFRQSRSVYKCEIDRLASIRMELLQGDSTHIKQHQSSASGVKETYIVPAAAIKNKPGDQK